MPNVFAINKVQQDALSVLGVEGFLDAHTAPEFERSIQSEIDGGHVRIVVNCEKLTYISSAGLGVFMSFVEEIRERGGDIKICGLIPKVKQVFEILGFPAIYDIVDDVPAAVRKFAEATARES